MPRVSQIGRYNWNAARRISFFRIFIVNMHQVLTLKMILILDFSGFAELSAWQRPRQFTQN